MTVMTKRELRDGFNTLRCLHEDGILGGHVFRVIDAAEKRIEFLERELARIAYTDTQAIALRALSDNPSMCHNPNNPPEVER